MNSNIRGKRANIMLYVDYTEAIADIIVDFLLLPTYQGIDKYKYICKEIEDNIKQEKLYEQIKYSSEHPIEFIERYLGFELKWYQKVLLKTIFKEKGEI